MWYFCSFNWERGDPDSIQWLTGFVQYHLYTRQIAWMETENLESRILCQFQLLVLLEMLVLCQIVHICLVYCIIFVNWLENFYK